MRFESAEFYVKSAAEMAALFPDHPEAIANSRRIAEMTDLALPLGQLRIPHFPVPDGETVESWLGKECQRASSADGVTAELQQRLDYELGVITSMGYAGYFLIVADFVRYAREQGIQTTCRGSAPGSIVTYTLGITPVDPIHYGLPFERFLNPDRVTMPDIDVDFEDDRRDEVIAYVASKYGQDRVAQIITFGTMLARAAIRDVGRVLGHSYGEVDRIAKAVPNQLGIRLDEALETSPQLREQYDADPQVKRVIGFAQQLEGVARNASTHAAGVVISREPLTELMPLQKATNSDSLMTQYEMHAIEALGLLKFDFLGLSNLTILRQAVDLVRANRGDAIDLDAIPLDDQRTFELLASGRPPASSSWSRRACAATSASCARRRSTTSPRWSRSTGPAPWTTFPRTSAANTAKSGSPTSTRCSSRTSTRPMGSSSTRRTSWPPRSRWAASLHRPRPTRSAMRSARRSHRCFGRRRIRHAGRGARRRAGRHRRGVQGIRTL